jgi:hypothetical protein
MAASIVFAGALLFATARPANAQVLPPPGNNYAQFAASWWKWFMELPLTNSAGVVHPGIDSARFDVTEGQSGGVWFLAAPFGTITRNCNIPLGKSLFVALIDAEWSSLEDPSCTTADCQTGTANYYGDHIVDVSCEIDGVAVANLDSFRVLSPQITFTAPSPWIFGATGGTGTSVGDGYYVLLSPLSAGSHTIHFGGAFLFTKKADGFRFYAPLDMTYRINVQ